MKLFLIFEVIFHIWGPNYIWGRFHNWVYHHSWICHHIWGCLHIHDCLHVWGCLRIWYHPHIWGHLPIWGCLHILGYIHIWGWLDIWGHLQIWGQSIVIINCVVGDFLKYTKAENECNKSGILFGNTLDLNMGKWDIKPTIHTPSTIWTLFAQLWWWNLF